MFSLFCFCENRLPVQPLAFKNPRKRGGGGGPRPSALIHCLPGSWDGYELKMTAVRKRSSSNVPSLCAPAVLKVLCRVSPKQTEMYLRDVVSGARAGRRTRAAQGAEGGGAAGCSLQCWPPICILRTRASWSAPQNPPHADLFSDPGEALDLLPAQRSQTHAPSFAHVDVHTHTLSPTCAHLRVLTHKLLSEKALGCLDKTLKINWGRDGEEARRAFSWCVKVDQRP